MGFRCLAIVGSDCGQKDDVVETGVGKTRVWAPSLSSVLRFSSGMSSKRHRQWQPLALLLEASNGRMQAWDAESTWTTITHLAQAVLQSPWLFKWNKNLCESRPSVVNHECVEAVQKRHGRCPEVQLGKPSVTQCSAQPLLMCTSAILMPKLSSPCDAHCWSLHLQLEPSWWQRVYLGWVIVN